MISKLFLDISCLSFDYKSSLQVTQLPNTVQTFHSHQNQTRSGSHELEMKTMFRKEFFLKNFSQHYIIPKRGFLETTATKTPFPNDTLGLKAFTNFLVFIFCKNVFSLLSEGQVSIRTCPGSGPTCDFGLPAQDLAGFGPFPGTEGCLDPRPGRAQGLRSRRSKWGGG